MMPPSVLTFTYVGPPKLGQRFGTFDVLVGTFWWSSARLVIHADLDPKLVDNRAKAVPQTGVWV